MKLEFRKVGIMDSQIVKIQNKGLITIPKKFRDELGFEKNSLARVSKGKGSIILEPVRTLPYPVRSYTDDEISKFIEKDIKETKKLKD